MDRMSRMAFSKSTTFGEEQCDKKGRNRGRNTYRLRRVKRSAPTSTADLIVNSFQAARARPFMAERFTKVLAALEQPTASPRAKMLVLNLLVCWPANPPLDGLTLRRPLFARTATRVTLMAAAIQQGPAVARALWFDHLICRHTMACCCHRGPATSAGDGCLFPTWLAVSGVTGIRTEVTAC